MKTTRKAYTLLTLIALLLISTLLFAACKDTDKPGETTPESDTADTTATTTPESDAITGEGDTTPADSETSSGTSAPETDAETLDAAAFLDKLMNAEDSEEDNYKTVMDMTVQMHMTAEGGYEQDLSMPMKNTEIVDGDNTHIIEDSMGEVYELIYVDGMMYVDYYGELMKCPATPEQFAEAANILAGSDTEEDDMTPGLEDLFTEMKAAELFASITAERQSGGSTVVTVKGFNKASADKIAPSLMPFLLSMGMVGADMEEYDEKALIAETAKVLREMNDDAMIITFTTDSEDKLMAVGFKITLSTTIAAEGVEIKTDLVMDGDVTHSVGGQSVKAPENAALYEEGTWDDFFGTPSPEDYGLIPDENGVITLSEDAELRGEQLYCIYLYADLFAETTFRVQGVVELYDDGSNYLTVYALDAEGAPDMYSAVEATPEAGKEAILSAVSTGEEAATKQYLLTGRFEILVVDEIEYLVLRVSAISPVAVAA